MDKSNTVSALPPTFNEPPPPYPGTTDDGGKGYTAGGFEHAPPVGPPPGNIILWQESLNCRRQCYTIKII